MTPNKRDAMSQQMLGDVSAAAAKYYTESAERPSDQVVIYRNRANGLREKQTIELDRASLAQPKPTVPVVILRKPASSKSGRKAQFILRATDGELASQQQESSAMLASGKQSFIVPPASSQPVNSNQQSMHSGTMSMQQRMHRGASQI
jgi:hypothetical protein